MQTISQVIPVALHKCIFEDIVKTYHRDVQAILAGLEPSRDDARHVRERKIRDMKLLLKKYEKSLYRAGRKGPCEVHQTDCKYHADDHRLPASVLKIHIAGTTCKDVSLMNASTRSSGCRDSGPAMHVLLVWMMERRHRREHIIVVECTPLFSVENLEEFLGEFYTITTIVIGPEDFGWWVNRKRRFCVLVLLRSCGGVLDTIGDLTQFAEVFREQRPQESVKGSMFWCASDEMAKHVSDIEAERLWTQKGYADNEVLKTGSMEARQVLYMKDYLHDRCQYPWTSLNISFDRLRTKFMKELTQREGSAIADLDQSPPMFKITSHLPCLLGHGTLWSFSHQRALIPHELLIAQGWPMLGLHDGEPVWSEEAWEEIDMHSQAKMAGNSIHLHVIGALVCWILATGRVVSEGQAVEQEQEAPAPSKKKRRQ